MRLLKNPTLRAATQATLFQRAFALLALVVLVGTVLFWPQIRDHTGAAIAQSIDNNYTPFQCGQQNISNNNQARRQNLNLFNGSGLGAYTAGKAQPCVSGVQWRLVIGQTNKTVTSTNDIQALISKVYPENGNTLYFAGTGSAATVHLGFSSLVLCNSTKVPNFDGAGWGCNQPTGGVQLYANSATSPTIKPTTPYQLNIVPSNAITIGGSGVLTDIWATPNSVISVPMNDVPLGTTGCGSLGVSGNTYGSGHNQTCEFAISTLTGGLAQNLAAGGNFDIVGMNLTFYYLITHSSTSTNPYNGSELTNPSIQLPNTRIKVGDGS